MNKVLVSVVVAIIGICILAQIGFTMPMAVESSSGPTINVEPSYLKVQQGDIFTVNITVNPDGIEIGCAQYDLYFNNMLLNVIEQTKGPFLSQDGVSTIPITNEFNNTIGKTEYGEFRTGVDYGVTTPGVLASITFEVIGSSGISNLKLSNVILSRPNATQIPGVLINNGMVEIEAPSTSFLIFGYVFYENESECNNPIVNVTNLNTSNEWQAETNATSKYYQLVLAHGIDINASETLQFDVTSPDGSQSKVFNHTVNETEINKGGIFDFNITLEPVQIIFDTGHGTYPSIMGTHEGNFTPKRNITVHLIYTYPCAGTGGHSERVIFCDYENKTEVINESWKGYQSDYHNITVPDVMLRENHVYNYTIITGSYPQIIHNQTCENDYGIITCTKFVDANGREYNDWIPAIRLG